MDKLTHVSPAPVTYKKEFYMYKVYHMSSGDEFFFERKPSKEDLNKALRNYDEDDRGVEIIKIKVIKNDPNNPTAALKAIYANYDLIMKR
jgi:hypothetical protein